MARPISRTDELDLNVGLGRGRGVGTGAGPGGYCVCPKCNTKLHHQRGVPCVSIDCPNCKTKMVRGQ